VAGAYVRFGGLVSSRWFLDGGLIERRRGRYRIVDQERLLEYLQW
jgi:hypothetical protein